MATIEELEKQQKLLEQTLEREQRIQQARQVANEQAAKFAQQLYSLTEAQNELRAAGDAASLQAAQDLQSEIDEVNQRISQTNAASQAVVQQLIAQEQKLKDIRAEIRQNNKEQEEAAERLQKMEEARLEILNGMLSVSSQISGLDIDGLINRPVSTVVNSMFELVLAADEAEVNIGKLSAGTRTLGSGMQAAAKRNNEFGATMGEMSQISADLITNFLDVQYLTETQQNAMQDLALEMERLGVSTTAFAQSMEHLTRSMGLTPEAAMETAQSMRDFAASIGVPPDQMAQDYTALAGEFSKYGAAGADAFQSLAKSARSLGIATDEAMKIAQLFDTFSEASETVGLLNAQLGIGLNAVTLMKAEESERIDILRAQFAQQGRNFQDMHRREQQAVARMLGVEVGMARRLFGTEQEFAEVNKEMDDARERQAALTTLQKQYASVLEALAPPLGKFAEFLKSTIKTLKENAGAVQAFIIAAMGFSAVLTLAKAIGGLTIAFSLFLPASSGASIQITAMGGALRQATPAILAFGLAVLTASLGLTLLVSQFAKMSSDQIFATTIALGVMTVGLVLLAFVVAKLAPAFIVAGVALGIFGAGLTMVSLAVFTMSAAFAVMGLGAQMAVSPLLELASQAGNLTLVAGSIFAISAALAALAATNIITFFTGNPLDDVTEFVKELSETNVDPTAINAVADLMVQTNQVMAAAPSLTSEHVQRVKQLVDSAIEIKQIGSAETAASINALNTFMQSGGNTRAAQQTQQRPFNINVNIDGKEAARVLYPHIRKKMSET